MFRNSEGYADPTAGAAYAVIRHEERQKKKEEEKRKQEIRQRKKVYIVSPYAGDTDGNRKSAIRYCCYAIRKKYIPIASHLLYPAMLREDVAAERELGIQFGISLLAVCDEVWVFGKERTTGMRIEISEAKRMGKTIRYVSSEVV